MIKFRNTTKLLAAGWILLMAVGAGARSRKPAAPAKAAAPPSIVREMLAVHNSIRAGLKLPPLEWSNRLALHSQKWANTLIARNQSAHNPNSPYGENIFITGIGSAPSTAVKEWASEARDYSYRTNTCSSDCGHYTQIVWRQTRRVGCAVSRGPSREIWVCSYDPPGNYNDEWPY